MGGWCTRCPRARVVCRSGSMGWVLSGTPIELTALANGCSSTGQSSDPDERSIPREEEVGRPVEGQQTVQVQVT